MVGSVNSKPDYLNFSYIFSERRGIPHQVSLDIKIGIEAKTYEGVS